MKHTLPHLVLAVEIQPVPLLQPLLRHLEDDCLHRRKATPERSGAGLVAVSFGRHRQPMRLSPVHLG